MIDEISNVSPQRVITPTNNVFDKPGENAKTGKSDQKVEKTTTRNVIENGTLIVEQYDRHGKLIRKDTSRFSTAG